MKRILISAAVLVAAAAFLVLSAGAGQERAGIGTYKVEFDNAFGLVQGADFKVAGVKAGKISKIDLDQKTLHAVITVEVTQAGFGTFHSDAFCESRPQSLIGEYFVECQPGFKGPALKPGSVIPVSHTQSTIPADLLQDVMRMPYRERFTLLINELGAAVAGRSEDIRSALARAVPALTETDNLLNRLANDSHTLQQLTTNSDQVITTLANNATTVNRFINESGRLATDTAVQQNNLRGTFARLPGFLEQLRPTMADLQQTVIANTPSLQNLNASAGQLNRLFTDIPPFARASLPALRALGKASVTGKSAVLAATPTVRDLNTFARPAPELAQNLAIVLRDLDSRSRAVEPDSRSPGGKGYTGVEDLLQFVFNTAMAINTFGPLSHELAVDLFVDPECTPYATPSTVAQQLAQDPNYRHCYAFLGPNQPGVTTTDPSNPGGCVPDPGGSPPGYPGASTSACKLSSAAAQAQAAHDSPHVTAKPGGSAIPTASARGGGGGGSGGALSQALGGAVPSTAGGSAPSASNPQTRQLLQYLLSP